MSNLAEEFRLAWSSVPLFRDILKKVKHQNVPLTQLEQEWKLQYPGENLAYFLQARLEQSIFDKLLLNEFCESLLEIINHGLSLNKCPLPLGYELVIVIQDYLSPDWEKLSVFNKDNKKRKASDNAGSSTSKKRKLTHAQCNSNDLKKNLKSLNYNEEQIKFILNYKRVAVEALILLHEKLSETLDHDSITSLIMGGRTALEFYLEKNVSLCNMGYTRTEIVKIGSHTGAPERYLMLEKYGEDLIRLGFIKEDITALLCSRAYKAPELLVTHFDQLIQLYDSPKNIIDMVKKEGIKYLRTILKMEPQDEIILIQKDDDSSSKIAVKDEKFLKVTYNPFSFYSSTSMDGDIDLLNSRIVII